MEQLDASVTVKNLLLDPVDLCSKLGLLEGSSRQARGVLIRCPFHGERHASCSVTTARDGTIRVKCFSCDRGGDALSLIAEARGLETSGAGFKNLLAEAAVLGGDLALADSLRDDTAPIAIARPKPAPKRVLAPEPTYPPMGEVEALWRDSSPLHTSAEAASIFLRRRIDPGAVEEAGVARVLGRGPYPRWASYRGTGWHTSHRIVLPVFSSAGEMRSVRAWRTSGDAPKRLPPAGHKASGLVLANRSGVRLLRRLEPAKVVYVVEGEPDFLLACTDLKPSGAVFGIGSGAWSSEFAQAIDKSSRVVVATHSDRAGDKYAANILSTLENHPYTWRAKIGPE